MKISKTAIPGLLIIEPEVFGDERGFFMEIYRRERFAEIGIAQEFSQDNLSRSVRNTLRGLHFQFPRMQGKLITVVRGTVLDVAVDIRVGSPTFGHHMAIELSEQNRRQFWIPRGFAHGFVVRSESAEIFYKSDQSYAPEDEFVLRWDDEALSIDWDCAAPILSARDKAGRTLEALHGNLPHFKSGPS